MTYFAKCVQTSEASKFEVVDNIRADQEFVDTQPGYWVQNDYNSYGNVHYAPSPPAEPHTPDGLPPLRANYAGIGFTLDNSVVIDGVVGVFYAPQPYPSWILNTSTYLWEAPVPYPTDGKDYVWDEATLSWVLVPTPA
jgi:hypothetical protein